MSARDPLTTAHLPEELGDLTQVGRSERSKDDAMTAWPAKKHNPDHPTRHPVDPRPHVDVLESRHVGAPIVAERTRPTIENEEGAHLVKRLSPSLSALPPEEEHWQHKR